MLVQALCGVAQTSPVVFGIGNTLAFIKNIIRNESLKKSQNTA